MYKNKNLSYGQKQTDFAYVCTEMFILYAMYHFVAVHMSVINCTVSTGDETTLNSREWLIRIVVGPLAAFMTIMSLMRCALKCPVSCQCKKTGNLYEPSV